VRGPSTALAWRPDSMNVGSSPIIAALAERAGIARAAGVDAACRVAASHHAQLRRCEAWALDRAFPAAASPAQIRAGRAARDEPAATPPPSDTERGLARPHRRRVRRAGCRARAGGAPARGLVLFQTSSCSPGIRTTASRCPAPRVHRARRGRARFRRPRPARRVRPDDSRRRARAGRPGYFLTSEPNAKSAFWRRSMIRR
jgi:hypothetical protein